MELAVGGHLVVAPIAFGFALARGRDPRMGVVPGKRKRSPDVIEMKSSSARKKK